MSPRRIFFPLLVCMLTSAAGAFGASPADVQMLHPGTIQARTAACAACHGVQGQGTDNDYFPRLAGKPAGYLFNQLKNFRDGRRRYPQMNYLMTYMSDDYLHQIADYFSSQRPPYPAPETPVVSDATVDYGKQLVYQGDPSRNIPACAACHGAHLMGTEPGIPGLVGLHSDYISAQLGAWRSGVRHANAPDCMQQIATRLTTRDVSAVAAWLSSQQAPANPQPDAAPKGKLPLVCGSEPQ